MVSLRGIARCSAAAGFLLGWSCLATVQAADGAAANYCTGRDVEARPAGGVQLAPQWKTILEKRFDGELGDWRINNYQKALIIEVADDPGLGRSLLVHRKGPKTDTAFGISSPALAVVEGARYRMTLWVACSCDLGMASGNGEFQTRIQWQDAAGREIGASPILFGDAEVAWRQRSVEAQAPRGAAKAVLQVGFDSPNLDGPKWFRLQRATWTALCDPAEYPAQGELVSRPQRLATSCAKANLSWQAVTPEATSVRFQVRSAADLGDGLGDWTSWAGPDGTAGTFFTASGTTLAPLHAGHRWFQYRLMLTTTNPRATPTVQQVRLGDSQTAIDDRAWGGPDTASPRLVQYHPSRTSDPRATLVFSLSDGPDGVGLDPRSVQVALDGVAIASQRQTTSVTPTGQPTVADDAVRFRCELREPLAPRVGLAPIEEWSVMNYNQKLTIRRGSPRETGGRDSLEIHGREMSVDTAFSLSSPPVAVQEGAAYRIAFWSRHAMDLRKTEDKGGYFSSVAWLDGQGKAVGRPGRLDLGGPSPQWARSESLVVAPPQARSAILRFGWDTPNFAPTDEVALADPVFDGPHPQTGPLPNLHRVTVKARDLAGNACDTGWWILVQPPPTAGQTTIRDDGVVLVDGRPFFPIGIYAVWKREHNGNDFDRCFTELRQAGFNTIHTYNTTRNTELAEFYAAADRRQLKVIIAPPGGANNRNPDQAIRTVVAECHQPALLSWYLADDTASHISAESLRAVHRAVRDVDPFHVTSQADPIFASNIKKSRYADYVESTDVFMPEIYPIHSDKQCKVSDVIRDMKGIDEDLRRAGHRAPVWAIIQDFEGWGWSRFPTDAEVRAMTYLAIIHGATGMTYYTYGGHGKNHGAPHDPKVWANLKQVTGQLAHLHDALVERTVPQTQRVESLAGPAADDSGYPPLSTRLIAHRGKHYLLTANSSRSPVRARITTTGTDQAQVLFEDRQVKASSGVWEDDFAPYAVHVYAW